MEALGVILLAGGAALVYAALTDQNPVTELRKALTTGVLDGPPAERQPFGVSLGFGTGTNVEPGAAPSVTAPGSTPDLVTIGQGGHRLDRPAAAAFAQAQAAYGRTIPITDSYRTPAQQAGAYADNPDRFGSAGTSQHVKGRAVDVNLPALGINPTGPPSAWLSNASYLKLYQAMQSAGWGNYQVARGSANGRTPEPWHFSWGVLG
jgi:hypothetical protein